uniref:Uncharacterized protein n=1 Tax=Anguilla anguilla TaxID=7936 RepID=A0A0E9UMZ1_ANGAN
MAPSLSQHRLGQSNVHCVNWT